MITMDLGKEIKKTDGMRKKLILRIEKQNAINKYRYNKDDSKRIIIGTLKPNCDKSLK